MKKVIISQPMRNLTEEEIKSNRDNVVTQLTELGYEVVEATHPDYIKHLAESKSGIPIYYLGKSIAFMNGVDVVYFMKGWEDVRGCKIEHQIAEIYELEVLYEQ